MTEVLTPAQWAETYSRRRSAYEDFASRVARLLGDIIRGAKLDVVQINHRAKTVDSFRGKLDRKGDRYKDPLTEVTDLAGIRVITYYLEDVEKVSELIRREFTVDESRSGDKASELGPGEFGYLSEHFIVSFSKDRSVMPEYADHGTLKAEIQVRTATQHAWASIEHKLQYKAKQNAPDEIRRRLYRLSALFELADDQFAQVRKVMLEKEHESAQRYKGGDVAVDLDSASIHAYLEESDAAKHALQLASEAGWIVQTEPDPFDPDRRERDLQDLVRTVRGLGVRTVGDLDELLSGADEVSDLLRAVAEREANDPAQRGHADGEAFPEDILNITAFLITRAEPDAVNQVYGGVTAEAINEAIAGGKRPMLQSLD